MRKRYCKNEKKLFQKEVKEVIEGKIFRGFRLFFVNGGGSDLNKSMETP